MYINFQQNRVKTQVITVLTSIIAKNRKLHKFATTSNIFFKSTLSDKHHLKTYMYINFQHNRVSRSVKTVYTNLFAKNCKLHKFATTNSNFEKLIFLDMHHHKTYMYINFQQNQAKTQVVTACTFTTP